jgi:hypothetical protein
MPADPRQERVCASIGYTLCPGKIGRYVMVCVMKLDKVFTKKPLVYRSFRLSHHDIEAWRTAAARLEISQSEFLRQALRDKAREVLVSKSNSQEV